MGVKTAYFILFVGVLFYLGGVIALVNGTIGGATVCGIIGTIFIYAGAHHAKKTRENLEQQVARLRQGATNPMPASGITCSNCGNVTDTMNSFCPRCGSRLTR